MNFTCRGTRVYDVVQEELATRAAIGDTVLNNRVTGGIDHNWNDGIKGECRRPKQ